MANKYRLVTTSRFEKDLKKCLKQGKKAKKIALIMEHLLAGKSLPKKYKDHMLKGNFSHCRECHIEPDWLLIYNINKSEKTIIFQRTGSHSDLF